MNKKQKMQAQTGNFILKYFTIYVYILLTYKFWIFRYANQHSFNERKSLGNDKHLKLE